MLGDRGVAGVGQSEFAQTHALFVDRQVSRGGKRQEAAVQNFKHLVAGEFRGARAAHKISAAAQDTDGKAVPGPAR